MSKEHTRELPRRIVAEVLRMTYHEVQQADALTTCRMHDLVTRVGELLGDAEQLGAARRSAADWEAVAEEMGAEVRRLWGALWKYGQHIGKCELNDINNLFAAAFRGRDKMPECICGLRAALAQTPPELRQKGAPCGNPCAIYRPDGVNCEGCKEARP